MSFFVKLFSFTLELLLWFTLKEPRLNIYKLKNKNKLKKRVSYNFKLVDYLLKPQRTYLN